MYIYCCNCEKILATKEPFCQAEDQEDYTSTYCDECLMECFGISPEKIYKYKENKKEKNHE